MKWAKTSIELDDENLPARDKTSFEAYERIRVDDSLPKGGKKAYAYKNKKGPQPPKEFFEWVTYDNLDPLKPRARRKYEIFVGGFLNFYDDKLKEYPQKIVDEYPKKFAGQQFGTECYKKLQDFFEIVGIGKTHEIYFDWGNDEANKGKIYVTIFINPPAGNPDPPIPPSPPPPESSN